MKRVAAISADFIQAKAGLLHALETVPNEWLNWMPAPTARSPLHQVVHAAEAIGHLHGTLDGRTFAAPSTKEADQGFRASERRYTSREEAARLLEEKASLFVDWLGLQSDDRLTEKVVMPFGMGTIAMEVAILFPALHTRWHHAQIDYIQTLYGDLDWHVGR